MSTKVTFSQSAISDRVKEFLVQFKEKDGVFYIKKGVRKSPFDRWKGYLKKGVKNSSDRIIEDLRGG